MKWGPPNWGLQFHSCTPGYVPWSELKLAYIYVPKLQLIPVYSVLQTHVFIGIVTIQADPIIPLQITPIQFVSHSEPVWSLIQKRETVKPGLWTLDWTVDWTMDWTMDRFGDDHYHSLFYNACADTQPHASCSVV